MAKFEDKLKESEIRYRRLFESAKDGILILDFKTGNIVDANPFIVQIIDQPLDTILGKKLWEIGVFSNKAESEEAFRELKRTGYIRFEDMPIQRQNGKRTDVEFISNVYFENKRKIIQCNIRNITERRASERKQELTAKILSLLGTQGNWKKLIHDILTEIKKHTGIEAVGIRLKENDDYPYYEAIGFREFFIQAEKSLCSVDDKGEKFHDKNGHPLLECICGNVISGRINHSLPYFTPGGSYYSNNASELNTACSEIEKQYTIRRRCNSEGYESIALIPVFSGIDVIGVLQFDDKRPGMVPLELIEFFEKIGNSIGIAFHRIQNETLIKQSEQILKIKNRDYKRLNNELAHSLIHIQNINKELLQSKLKAEESDKLKSVFLANMSHEIRTPMNAIVGFSDVLMQPGITNESFSKYVQIIHASSLQLLSVISDIIDISQLEAGQITVSSELVDIEMILNDLFLTYNKLVEIKKLRLTCNFESRGNHLMILTDGNRIKQILCNLLNNAIKFTKAGKIDFGYSLEGQFIKFYVIDTGIGIDPEHNEKIFVRFAQIPMQGKQVYGGNGLGLSISKALVEKLGGKISFESEPGKGTKFMFTIPYKQISGSVKAESLRSTTEEYHWNESTILIVEDEANNHAFIEELFSLIDVKLLHAWDGNEAVELVEAHPQISLVLMDMKMPFMDGYTATRLIKKIRPSLPVIAQTAYALAPDRKQAIECGCDDFIVKPIDRILFMKMIDKYLSTLNNDPGRSADVGMM